MSIKRIVMHLGTGKAGSTSIQNSLFDNSGKLEENGFRYLNEWGKCHIRAFRNLFSCDRVPPMDLLFGPYLPEEERQKDNEKLIDTMLSVMNTSDCETLILSGEYWDELCLVSYMDKIKQFINNHFISKGIEFTIVYIVRNPLVWIISYLQEALKSGFYNRLEDFYEGQLDKYFKAIDNLIAYFNDSLILLKFEDAVNDSDGLIGCFLKTIGFPQNAIQGIKECKANESCCMEAVEFFRYVDDKEPYLPCGNNKEFVNPKRSQSDLHSMRDIKGAKFDLPYQSKTELWKRIQEQVYLLKRNTGIDYTDYQIPMTMKSETYSEDTLRGFVEAFHKFSPALKKLFLEFFEQKYLETAQVKYKQLCFQDSKARLQYNKLSEDEKKMNSILYNAVAEKNAILNSRSWQITKPLRKMMDIFRKLRGCKK